MLNWRNDDNCGDVPKFSISSSPLIADGMYVVQFGGDRGGIVAYDLESVKERWKWTKNGASHGSPVLMNDMLFGLSTANQLFCVQADTGKMTWNHAITSTAQATPRPASGRGGHPGAQGDR